MKILYYSGWSLIRIITKTVFRIRVSGTEHIPKTNGFILAANHISYFDPPFVGSWSPRQMYFFAKKELFDHWLLGALLRRVNAFPVRRGTIDRQALEMAVDAVRRGYGLTIFPEGTRSKGDDFLDPKPGVGMIAKQTHCPIVPCYVHGTNKLSKCAWGRQRLGITFDKPLSIEWIASFPEDKDGYLLIAQEVMKRIALLKESTLKKPWLSKGKRNHTENKNNRKMKKALENP